MSKKNKTHDSVIDIFYYKMFSLFVGILIVIGCLYLFYTIRTDEVNRHIESGYDLYINGQKADVDKIDIEHLHGTFKINDDAQEVYVTY